MMSFDRFLCYFCSAVQLHTSTVVDKDEGSLLWQCRGVVNPTEVVSLALTAAQCMREVIVATETKQFKNPSVEKYTETGKVCKHISHKAVCTEHLLLIFFCGIESKLWFICSSSSGYQQCGICQH